MTRPAEKRKVITMKKICVMLAAVACAAAALQAQVRYDDFKPGKTFEKAPTATDWQRRNAKVIAAATCEKTLSALVADTAAAEAFLARLRGPYATDPVVMTQLGALSQWVVAPAAYARTAPAVRAKARALWVEALMKKVETSADADIQTICLDQLRWCGTTEAALVARVSAIAKTARAQAVKDFAAMVVRELQGRGVGK